MISLGRVAVIGGSGFVGRHLIRRLQSTATQKTICVDFNEPQFIDTEGVHYVKATPGDFSYVETSITNGDQIVFCGGISDLDACQENVLEVYERNVIDLIKLFERLKNKKIQRFIYVSSVYAAGDHGGFYGATKSASERIVIEYSSRQGFDPKILRVGSVYGPNSGPVNPVWRIVSDAVSSGCVTIRRPLTSQRKYLHVDDLASQLFKLLSSQLDGTVFSCYGVESHSLDELILLLSELLGRSIEANVVDESGCYHYQKTPCSPRPIVRSINLDSYIELANGLSDLLEEIQIAKQIGKV